MVWGFVTCGPNEALVVSGCCYMKPLLVPGGRAFVWPTIQQVQRISLNTMTLQVESPCVYTSQGVPISVTGIAQVKIQGQNEDMLLTACEQFLGKGESEIQHIALVTLEGHQRAIMGSMTVEEIYKDRKKFSKQVFEVASSDLANMGITVVSYTIKDIRDEEVSLRVQKFPQFIVAYVHIPINTCTINTNKYNRLYVCSDEDRLYIPFIPAFFS
uniref:Flotillin-1 n=1 Tax=Bactrocera latifrons TaxID=174628 RepID=A0A0K8V245_BACLA